MSYLDATTSLTFDIKRRALERPALWIGWAERRYLISFPFFVTTPLAYTNVSVLDLLFFIFKVT